MSEKSKDFLSNDLNAYKKLVIKVVRNTIFKLDSIPSLSEEDLVQEGMIALLRAVKTFKGKDEGGSAKFETYASTCIKNRLIDILRKESTQIQPNTDSEKVEDFAASRYKVEFLEKEEILKRVLKTCNEIERAILNSYLQGFSYAEIAKIFEISNKKIDNTIQKIKLKIKHELE